MNRFTEHVTINSGDAYRDCLFEAGFTATGDSILLQDCISLRDSFVRNAWGVVLERVRCLYGNEHALLIDDGNNVQLLQCEFANAGTDKLIRNAVLGVGLRIEKATDVRVEMCDVHDNNWDGIQTVHEVERVTILRCTCEYNGKIIDGRRTTHGDGINIAGLIHGVIRECLCENNARHGITIKKLLGGSVRGDTTDILVEDNRCQDNGVLYAHEGHGLHIEEGHADRYRLRDIRVRGGIYSGQAHGIVAEGDVQIYHPTIRFGLGTAGSGITCMPSVGWITLCDPHITGDGDRGIDIRDGGKLNLIGGTIIGQKCQWGIVTYGTLDMPIPPIIEGEFVRGRAHNVTI